MRKTNNVQIIGTFKYKGKDFVISFIDSKLKFFYKQKDEFKNDFTDEEKIVLFIVSNSICMHKEAIVYCGEHLIGGQYIKVFLDTKSNFYYFETEKEEIEQTNLMRLNNYFNSQTGNHYRGRKILTKKTFNRLLLIGGTLITLNLASGSNIRISPSNIDIDLKGYTVEVKAKESRSKEEKKGKKLAKKVLNSIDDNSHLSDEEKKFCSLLYKEIEENAKYINEDTATENMEDLKIIYNELSDEDSESDFIRLGSFNDESHKINLYGYDDDDGKFKTTNLNDSDKSSLFHELNHAISKPGFTEETTTYYSLDDKAKEYVSKLYNGSDTNQWLEGFDELFSREYYKSATNQKPTEAYDIIMPIIYASSEIFSEDTIRKYKFDPDYSILVKELMKYDPDPKKAYEFIFSLNLSEYYSSEIDELTYSKKPNSQKIKQVEEEYKKNNKKTHDLLAYYYEKKYGEKMTENLNILSYLYKSEFETDEEINCYKKAFGESFYALKVFPKGYVSEDFKKENRNTVIKIYTYGYSENKEYKIENAKKLKLVEFNEER